MAIRDDLVMLLRQDLGAGFEAATLAQLMKEHTSRCYRGKLRALYHRRLDDAALVAARVAAETALRTESTSRAATLAVIDAQLDTDMGAL